MTKLVYMFRHKKPIAIGLRGYGLFYPPAELRGLGFEPMPGREAEGIEYHYEDIIQVTLLPETPDELPESLRDGDPDFVREFKLSQAKQIAENIKINEFTIRDLKSHEASGNIELLGRVLVDENGQIVKKKDQVVKEKVEEPKSEEPVEVIAVPERKAGRPKKQAEPTNEEN